jgi:hypothetical protein
MGRELFDHAFKTYAQRWAYKHPMPADFFRTMEDASAVDLDWFWRGWFYTTDRTDLALESVKHYNVNTKNPGVEKTLAAKQQAAEPRTLSQQRNAQEIKRTLVDEKPELKDFYNNYDPLAVTEADKAQYFAFLNTLTPAQQQRLNDNLNVYELSLRNIGGLVMPVIIQLTYEDGTKEIQNIPAEIWRKNNAFVTKVIATQKPVVSFVLDPYLETADTDLSNNAFPRQAAPSRFELFQQGAGGNNATQPANPMRQQKASVK